MTDRELIERLIDALQRVRPTFVGLPATCDPIDAAIAEARAALAASDWVRVEDALPVVPEGQRCIAIWAFTSCVYEMTWFTYSTLFMPQVTHWRYFEQPKEPTC